jgi:hypothetical protein
MSPTDEMAAFVTATLHEFGTDHLLAQARDRIRGRNITVDEELLRSLAVTVATNELNLWFADHGRMHDMGAGRGYRKGKFMGSQERGQLLKGRKPSKWYSRLAWGSVYGTLVDKLSNSYIANVPGQLARGFNQQ